MNETMGQSENTIKTISVESHPFRTHLIGASVAALIAVGLFIEKDQPAITKGAHVFGQIGSGIVQIIRDEVQDECKLVTFQLRELGIDISTNTE